MFKPVEGAKKLLKVNLDSKPDEFLLVLAESSTSEEAKYFLDAAKELELNAFLLVMPDLHYNGEEPSKIVQKAMMLPDIIVIATKHSISTIDSISKASKKGIRILSIPGFKKEMLIKGPIEADFLRIKPRIWHLARLFEKAEMVQITSRNGSKLSLSIKGRTGNVRDALAREPGDVSSMSVEANAAPIEDSANGILMIDVAAPTGIILDEPLKITFDKGVIVKIEGNDNAIRLKKYLDEIRDKNIFRIAELGIGLNPASKLTGKNYIEDESSIGTAHIGIGRNTSLGGKTRAKGHFDLIFKNPNILFDGSCIMKNGKLQF